MKTYPVVIKCPTHVVKPTAGTVSRSVSNRDDIPADGDQNLSKWLNLMDRTWIEHHPSG